MIYKIKNRVYYWSSIDIGIALTYFIHTGWIKNISTSMLVFNIVQFFLLLNHQLLLWILNKRGFDPKVSLFFQNYLIGRRTKYLWNSFSFSFFDIDVGVGQGSTLFPILSALYLAPILYIFEKRIKILKILISILSVIDDGLFISQNKSLVVLNTNIFCSYNVISSLLRKFRLIIEHRKTEVFYFSRLQWMFTPSLLDFTPLGGHILYPKTTLWCFGFIFNWKLLFCQYINFYTTKAISIIKYMKMLGNLSRSLISIQKQCLYRCCILPITLYSFQL